LNPASKSKKKR